MKRDEIPFLITEKYHNTYMGCTHVESNYVKPWQSKQYRIVSSVRIWLNAMHIFLLVLTGTRQNPIPVN
jgi:hypothetical protein